MLTVVLVLACCCTTDVLSDTLLSDRNHRRDRRAGYHWTGVCIDGRAQSPIDLVLGDAEITYNGELLFTNYGAHDPKPLTYVDAKAHA
ncbi:hypothetical protein COOONC_13903, partial [Cooperia oncophora]